MPHQKALPQNVIGAAQEQEPAATSAPINWFEEAGGEENYWEQRMHVFSAEAELIGDRLRDHLAGGGSEEDEMGQMLAHRAEMARMNQSLAFDRLREVQGRGAPAQEPTGPGLPQNVIDAAQEPEKKSPFLTSKAAVLGLSSGSLGGTGELDSQSFPEWYEGLSPELKKVVDTTVDAAMVLGTTWVMAQTGGAATPTAGPVWLSRILSLAGRSGVGKAVGELATRLTPKAFEGASRALVRSIPRTAPWAPVVRNAVRAVDFARKYEVVSKVLDNFQDPATTGTVTPDNLARTQEWVDKTIAKVDDELAVESRDEFRVVTERGLDQAGDPVPDTHRSYLREAHEDQELRYEGEYAQTPEELEAERAGRGSLYLNPAEEAAIESAQSDYPWGVDPADVEARFGTDVPEKTEAERYEEWKAEEEGIAAAEARVTGEDPLTLPEFSAPDTQPDTHRNYLREASEDQELAARQDQLHGIDSARREDWFRDEPPSDPVARYEDATGEAGMPGQATHPNLDFDNHDLAPLLSRLTSAAEKLVTIPLRYLIPGAVGAARLIGRYSGMGKDKEDQEGSSYEGLGQDQGLGQAPGPSHHTGAPGGTGLPVSNDDRIGQMIEEEQAKRRSAQSTQSSPWQYRGLSGR